MVQLFANFFISLIQGWELFPVLVSNCDSRVVIICINAAMSERVSFKIRYWNTVYLQNRLFICYLVGELVSKTILVNFTHPSVERKILYHRHPSFVEPEKFCLNCVY